MSVEPSLMIPGSNVERPQSYGSHRWFALRVRSRCEKTVAAAIRQKGLEEFLPLYQRNHRWSDRIKRVELPLIPGYVFCHMDPQSRMKVVTIPGAIDLVGIGRTAAPIEDSEIAALRLSVNSGLATEPWPKREIGQLVRVDDGPLAGTKGLLIEARNKSKLIVSVTLLDRSLAVEIDRRWVSPSGALERPIEVAQLT
jgi:transcription antitermination factor NusG